MTQPKLIMNLFAFVRIMKLMKLTFIVVLKGKTLAKLTFIIALKGKTLAKLTFIIVLEGETLL